MTTTPATLQQIELLHHTLGLRPDRREPFRNYFVAGPGHHDMAGLEALERLGLMGRHRAPSFCDPSDVVFYTTDKGQALALEMLPEPPPPPKHSQHREWIDADSSLSFSEWLCGGRLPVFETRGYCGYGARNTMEYRMYRNAWDGIYGRYREVEGQWASTKKEAKASYKAALKAHRSSQRATAQLA